jgi:DNA-binding NarL/FixJ family response regulator
MKNILIIEDLPDVTTWFVDIVEQSLAPEDIHCADNLEKAKTLILKHQYSLALIDIGLPDGSGIEALKLIKTKNEHCFCVISTIFDDSEHLFTALRQGADGYILKNEERDELIEHLQGILVGKPPLSPVIAKKVLSAFKPERDMTVKLSPREEQILTFIAKGYSIPSAAKLLNISQHTAADYLKQVYKKLHVNNRADATLKAYELGFVSHGQPYL